MFDTEKVTLADALSEHLLNNRYDRGEAIMVEELLANKQEKQPDKE